MHRLTISTTAVLLLALAVPSAVADGPMPGPIETQFRSQNGRFLAISDPVTWVTTVYELEPPAGARTKRWSMYAWVREAALANDGEHLLVVTLHSNLIPIDFDKNSPVLYLVHKGELVKTASVMDVVKRESNLKRTVSHYHWAMSMETDQSGHYRIGVADGSVFFMNLTTGATGVVPAEHRSKGVGSTPR